MPEDTVVIREFCFYLVAVYLPLVARGSTWKTLTSHALDGYSFGLSEIPDQCIETTPIIALSELLNLGLPSTGLCR
ncbi:hypothetical protein BDW02DRAFT_567843 [Decorospora gaudefroyi]|uniref:Uncharacterized protein n=1 Tax=Decorospora gaudefroyi TaxID=184978 RepID=A0A6A5KIK4_9PLEO|nr:hypothetical protein BDW02DRAFT_567843 [Decorospora gaudefroyi]